MCCSQGLVLPEAPGRVSSITHTQAVQLMPFPLPPSSLTGLCQCPCAGRSDRVLLAFPGSHQSSCELAGVPSPPFPPKLGHLNLTCYQQMRLECFHCGKESHSESVLSPAQAPSLHIPFLELGVSFLLFPSCPCWCHCHSTDTTADGAGLCSGAFWGSFDAALPAGSEASKTPQRPKRCKEEKPVSCLGRAAGLGACSGVGLWQEELEGASGALWI